MNIDLLLTANKESGLLCDGQFPDKIVGICLDASTGELALVFGNGDLFELNIPLEIDLIQPLLHTDMIQAGEYEKGTITDSRQVPLIFRNEIGEEGIDLKNLPPAANSAMSFENFIKKCNTGQPVHRGDLGDEADIGSVVGGMSTAAIQLAPQLTRQKSLEAAPKAPALANAPKMSGPSGMSGPGGMGPSGIGGGTPRGDQTMPSQHNPGQIPDSDDDY